MQKKWTILTVCGCLAFGHLAMAQSSEEKIEALERKVELLSKQVEKSLFKDIFSEVGQGQHGMAPSASKVYNVQQGVSIGGYGEAIYVNKDEGSDSADFLRAILYFGYKYTDKWVFNSEIEFEHASTDKSGSASVEFAYLDYLHAPELNFRAGLVLVPMGWVNELHEPNTFLSARRPDIESRIIPTTWRENGIGVFGTIADHIDYKAYLLNGMDGSAFDAKGLRGGRQKGSKAKADDLAGVIRVDVTPSPGLVLGASVYYGDSGQDLEVDVSTEIYEAHLDYRNQGLSLRALVTEAHLDDVAELNRLRAEPSDADGMLPADSDIDSIGEELFGWYVEIGYDVLNKIEAGEKSLTPFLRYSEYNTQEAIPSGFKRSGKHEVDVITIGLNFKPIDEIVFKADYQFYDDKADSISDQLNLSVGYAF